jgi:predicted membrane-bound spermidine synthase
VIRSVALLLTILTGFSGLVYEVTWQKYLATLLGSHAEATAAVLALFLGGLSVGYSLFGRASRRLAQSGSPERVRGRLLGVYGLIELGIGLYAFAFPLAFAAARSISLWIPVEQQGISFAFDVALSALLIGPPAILMGATIPMLTQALARALEDATRFHALVYGLNTGGAFAGALAAAFWLVPRLGLMGVLVAMGLVNTTAGIGFLLLARRAPREAVRPVAGEGTLPSAASFGSYAAVALLVGFAMMAVQAVLIRVGGLSLGSSPFTFAMVVAVFVLCIALGSLAVSLPARIPRAVIVINQWLLLLSLGALYLGLDAAPYWAHVLRTLFRSEPEVFHAYWFAAFLGLLAFLGLPVVFSGAVLPLLFHRLRHEVGELGDLAGRLYSWNTVGSLLGALFGGYLLFFWLDLHEVFRIALASLLAAAVLLSARVLGRDSMLAWGSLSAAALVALALLPAWSPQRLAFGLFRMRAPTPLTHAGPAAFYRDRAKRYEVLFYEDDATSSIAVTRDVDQEGALSIIHNGKSDGSLVADYPTMALTGLIPALLAERPARAFVVGYGTGVTVGELAALPEVEEVVVAEISRGVLRAAPFFDAGNLGASANPKVRVVRGDAYRVLLRSAGRFDVIASEPSNPWMAGVEMLYSEEFLRAARGRLNPGGVYAQWFHGYETDRETVSIVLRTYASVFDDVAIWYTLGPDLLLIGFAEGNPDPFPRLVERAASPAYQAGLARAGIEETAALLAHELVPRGVLRRRRDGGPVHTLLHPILTDRAARAFFSGGLVDLPSFARLREARAGERSSFLRRYVRENGGALPPRERALLTDQLCQSRPEECAVALAAWLHEEPSSLELAKRIIQTRKHFGIQGPPFSSPFLNRLSRFFEAEGSDRSHPTPEAVGQETQVFAEYYLPGLPFERRYLTHLLDRCATDPENTQRCLEERKKAERQLGQLGAGIGS